MKILSITICKTHILKDLIDRVDTLETLKLRRIDCPTCQRETLARQRYYEEGGGLYCYSCGKVCEKKNKDIYYVLH